MTYLDAACLAVIALCGIGAFSGLAVAVIARLAERNDLRKGRLS